MSARSPELRREIAAAGGAARHRTADADSRRAALAERRIAEHIRRVCAAAPPLSAEQRNRLAGLLAAPAGPDIAAEQDRTGDALAVVAEHAACDTRDGAA